MPTVFILNGPNLNLLGSREPAIYGDLRFEALGELCRDRGTALGMEIEFRQSNHEGELVSWVQEAATAADGLVLNAGAYSHTSIAVLDALRAFSGPIIEVHLSNIFRRESYRHHSYVSLAADGVICGLGHLGYLLALDALADRLSKPSPASGRES